MMNNAEPQSNVPEFSVSDLAFSLKQTLENTYGRVRVRGELSRISIPKSGHLYTGLKDDKSVLDAVCWRGVLSKLSIRPEEGMEVICIGKITTYPMSSKYQLVIESMELAGEGALLKMLEERKKKLAAEGLFHAERKKNLPFLPRKIGVVTSPTGAVIRDIIHRLNDRFPMHVLIWPVKVQGEGADTEITNAIHGFNALPETHRPDVLIVARGGGSLEDLMAFNAENVVRAAAASHIPLISAVGHETDTTLIDYAADLRAPTPTGAAELAVPVRINLMAQVVDDEQRLINCATRMVVDKRQKLENLSARLGDPMRLFEMRMQRLDHGTHKMENAFQRILSAKREQAIRTAVRLLHPAQLIDKKENILINTSNNMQASFKHMLIEKSNHIIRTSAKLQPPKARLEKAETALQHRTEKLDRAIGNRLEHFDRHLKQSSGMLELLSFENVLKRGFVVVKDQNGKPVTDSNQLNAGQNINLQFKGNNTVSAVVSPTKTTNDEARQTPLHQKSLF